METKTTNLALVTLILWLSGCSRDDVSQEPFHGTYIGAMTFDIDTLLIGHRFTDTVRLTIDGSTYTFETLEHTVTGDAPLCDVRGHVSGFGGNSAVFTPTDTLTQACSARYTLRGTFPTVFKGDSLIMVKADAQFNTFHDFRLCRRAGHTGGKTVLLADESLGLIRSVIPVDIDGAFGYGLNSFLNGRL